MPPTLDRVARWLPGRCRIPRDVESVASGDVEVAAREVGIAQGAIDRIWDRTKDLYSTGVHPAIQLCVRHHGKIVLHRAIGHARGNAPGEGSDVPKIPVTTETPFCLFSASKAITAMVIHKLDEERLLHLEDRVCDFIPEFARHGKEGVTIRHLLAHRAGIPNLPPEAMDLDLLRDPATVNHLLCDSKLRTRPGRLLAYHAVTGGFVLAEIVQRATGRDIRQVLEKEIAEPLGLHWLSYGVAADEQEQVAVNAVTGPPAPPPLSTLLRRALGADLRTLVDFSNDPRFFAGIIPAANVVTTAEELTTFFQCLLDEGEWRGARVFEPNTVRHASAEQSYLEFDFTLGIPLRYGLGMMLGDRPVGLFGQYTEQAFGHLGFTNIFAWADPERRLSVALLTSGKPIVSLHAVRLFQLLIEINRAFPKGHALP